MSDDELVPQRSKRLRKDAPDKKMLTVILENAQLETAKVGGDFVLLSSDQHVQFLKRHHKDPANYRPDITHQCLLMLLDSPLNRAGLLNVYIHTTKNVLIHVNPQTRIPRTFDRFCGLMVQLLYNLNIRATTSSERLLKIVRNPVTEHLPVGCKKYCMSVHTEDYLDLNKEIGDSAEPIVVVVGAMARGKVSVDYTEKDMKLSSYPLSAALACAKLCGHFEDHWGIK